VLSSRNRASPARAAIPRAGGQMVGAKKPQLGPPDTFDGPFALQLA
jgi:hypothetical protein